VIELVMDVKVEIVIELLLGVRREDSCLRLATQTLENKVNAQKIISLKTLADRQTTFIGSLISAWLLKLLESKES